MTLARWSLAAVVALSAVAAACGSDGSTTLSGNSDVLSKIPWTAPETATYRLLDGKKVIGSGELSVKLEGEALVFTQGFSFPDQEIDDTVRVTANPGTLAPAATARVIKGPEGDRNCEATYRGSTVTVAQSSKDDERTDELDVPVRVYDTWSDLFLWRTLAFAEDYEVKYLDALTCSLGKPEVLSVVLKVKGREKVTVPAGEFDTWRLEVRSGGRTQKAWYADDAARTLVRYDNGDLVFELESLQ